MLAKENRLTKDKEFDYVFKKGRGSYDQAIGIKVAKNSLTDNRFGIMVSAKVSKKAVERNKIKRRIREIIKKNLPSLKKGFDIVIIAQAGVAGVEYGSLEKSLLGHFKKIGLNC